MIIDRNVPVRVRDGVTLMANVYRPERRDRFPVVVSMTPYGKDLTPDRIGMTMMRLSGVRFGHLQHSRWTGFESPDPHFWTDAGYAVVQADVRGMHSSPGNAGVLTNRDAEDYYDVIAWAARQLWSSGAIGLCGVSYLAMSQWRVAALRPPSLRAIIPWEGVTDMYREFAFQEGIPETRFLNLWWRFRMQRGRNPRFAMAEDFMAMRDAHPLDDEYWAEKRPRLEAIEVPALICASWSDHGLHTRGSFEGFARIGSTRKWLFTHGRRKWETFYSEEALATQRRFFDYFLRSEPNGWEQTPHVRLEVRNTRDRFTVRNEHAWPLASVRYTALYLDAGAQRLTPARRESPAEIAYDATGRRSPGRASFSYRFARNTELTGGMSLKLWVATTEGDDLDLFVVVRKFDVHGHESHFYGFNGFANDVVAKGWLRASHRELDPNRTRPGRPWHTHRREQLVSPGETFAVDIEILSSSTLFEAGSTLRLDVLGHDAARYPAFRHRRTRNRGRHVIHTGGPFDSALLVPVVGGEALA